MARDAAARDHQGGITVVFAELANIKLRSANPDVAVFVAER